MSKVQTILQHAEQQCKSHGTRLTEKRKDVLLGLLQSDKALSAYELADYCKSQLDKSIPAMSVYRILDFLQNQQLVHRLKLANKYVACSHISCDHAHEVPQFLICHDCSRVKEIALKKTLINTLQQNVENAGYRLTSSQLELDCLCQPCADKVQ